MSTRAVFFDVDFTLIHPGRTFQGPGYADFCARHGVTVDPARFMDAVRAASSTLHAEGSAYDPAVFIDYTCRIIEAMGGTGPGVVEAAKDLYEAWPECEHFALYEEVPDVLRAQRSLIEFERHFDLGGLFSFAISSFDHGYMKPHPSIFEEALRQARVAPAEAVMVGDSVPHDITGALRMGMRGVLVARSGLSTGAPADVPVIQTLRELPPLL
jgi:FMN phosphatase YigB (HAD superfamily)